MLPSSPICFVNVLHFFFSFFFFLVLVMLFSLSLSLMHYCCWNILRHVTFFILLFFLSPLFKGLLFLKHPRTFSPFFLSFMFFVSHPLPLSSSNSLLWMALLPYGASVKEPGRCRLPEETEFNCCTIIKGTTRRSAWLPLFAPGSDMLIVRAASASFLGETDESRSSSEHP